MATRRTTHDKRQRERSKQEKAAAKRERRQDKGAEVDEDVASDDDDATTEQLVERIQELHAEYDAGRISFEDFDEQRAVLTDRIALRLAE
jgi:hypothetical protein